MEMRPQPACPSPPQETSDTPLYGQTAPSLPRRPRLPSVGLSVAPAQPAARPPPVPCKAKAGALLGRKERDNASQAALRSGTGALQKDATGNPRDRHFHM